VLHFTFHEKFFSEPMLTSVKEEVPQAPLKRHHGDMGVPRISSRWVQRHRWPRSRGASLPRFVSRRAGLFLNLFLRAVCE
jgi:hypothetical protein